MLSNAEMIRAIAVKAEEQNEALTLFARKELGLPNDFVVKLKVSIKQIQPSTSYPGQ